MKDQVALITGASGGIGSAIAEALAREGVRLDGGADRSAHPIDAEVGPS